MFASNTTNHLNTAGRRNVSPQGITTESPLTRLIVLTAVLGATIYQALLCLANTHLFRTSTGVVALVEFSIYLLCLFVILRRISLDFIAILTLVASYLLLLALLRSSLDIKGFRDLIIPLLFFWLGKEVGSINRADKILKIIILVVLVMGCFELFFVDLYSRIFNIFSYYGTTGGMNATTNWAGGTLALNGTRPDGIGRTILPSLLGAHRVSSIFLEPVSLGNFAVITAAWGLAKKREEFRKAAFFLVSAAVMITMADSRYGLATVMVLVAMRFIVSGRMNIAVIAGPILAVIILLIVPNLTQGHFGDDALGRLVRTGRILSGFGTNEIFGLSGYAVDFGDMGYAVALTRFGLILCAVLWIGFWMIKMRDDTGSRFRTYVAVYASLILMVSGTSLFALKTAGILWFLVGCCAKNETPTEAPDKPPSKRSPKGRAQT
ncbi:polysaccharide polymerase [Actimicrobium sp. CCI2.3]|uniref:polysaccharide polymerase n=1 Tax=Actimicrobium sp. CCI2.3 TaxID=3048616 RepID=UPI002AB5BEBD|nr:polysaccharide polymerase [Actimicrobium sp. CCI2.3]MDY7576651.1 polysaccharide polymerase [Actimicrobium sp. CCI2.3]MEB0021252.1 polysaccharide polymerase [Actimicrobium sp. CCI2.3]